MLLANYKSRSSTNVSEYYSWQYVLKIQNIYVETVFCSFLRLQNFGKYRKILLMCPECIYGQRKNQMGLYFRGLYSSGETLQFAVC